jgi:hypothetical protein
MNNLTHGNSQMRYNFEEMVDTHQSSGECHKLARCPNLMVRVVVYIVRLSADTL